jgi:hypothetical protein
MIYNTTVDLTNLVNELVADGHPVRHGDLAPISPYITSESRRFGDWGWCSIRPMISWPGSTFPRTTSKRRRSDPAAGRRVGNTHARTGGAIIRRVVSSRLHAFGVR